MPASLPAAGVRMEAHKHAILQSPIGFAIHKRGIPRRKRNRRLAIDVRRRGNHFPRHPSPDPHATFTQYKPDSSCRPHPKLQPPRSDVAHAVAEANHVGNDDASFALRAIADVDIAVGACFEVIRSEINEPVSHASMIDLHFRDSARVIHTVKLIGRPIAAGTGPRIDRIEAGFRNIRRVPRIRRFFLRSVRLGDTARAPALPKYTGRVCRSTNRRQTSRRHRRYPARLHSSDARPAAAARSCRAGAKQVVDQKRHLIDSCPGPRSFRGRGRAETSNGRRLCCQP